MKAMHDGDEMGGSNAMKVIQKKLGRDEGQ